MKDTPELLQTIEQLPPDLQRELLDFARFLLERARRQEEREWAAFSLTQAMQGMEDEEALYTLDDLRVSFQ